MNGSSIDGNCSRDHYVTSSSFRTCNLPTSSVLFDGNIPTLTGLDGDVWASQLLTIQKLASHHQDATIEFRFSPIRLHHAERIEVVAFNCPEWGSSFETVRVTDGSREVGVFNVTNITSCYSLVRLCLPVATTSSRVILGFSPPHDYHWIHIAEVTFFYRDGSSCTEGSLTPPPVLETAITTSKLKVCNLLESICMIMHLFCELVPLYGSCLYDNVVVHVECINLVIL